MIEKLIRCRFGPIASALRAPSPSKVQYGRLSLCKCPSSLGRCGNLLLPLRVRGAVRRGLFD